MEHQQSYQGQGQGPDGTPGGPGGAPDLQTLGAGAGIGLPPQMHQQLPAQMFTTAAQLLDLTDSKAFPYFSCFVWGIGGMGEVNVRSGVKGWCRGGRSEKREFCICGWMNECKFRNMEENIG